jgi:hypothetical protein
MSNGTKPPLPSDSVTEDERAMAGTMARALGDSTPRTGWQAVVWSRIERQQRRRRWTLTLIPLGAAAAAALLLFWRSQSQPLVATNPAEGRPLFAMRTERAAGATRTRGDVQAGDELIVEAKGLPAAWPVELRIYGPSGDLRLRCDRQLPCRRSADGLEARVRLPDPGTYRVLVVKLPALAPAPVGRYDEDTASLIEQGGELLISRVFAAL